MRQRAGFFAYSGSARVPGAPGTDPGLGASSIGIAVPAGRDRDRKRSKAVSILVAGIVGATTQPDAMAAHQARVQEYEAKSFPEAVELSTGQRAQGFVFFRLPATGEAYSRSIAPAWPSRPRRARSSFTSRSTMGKASLPPTVAASAPVFVCHSGKDDWTPGGGSQEDPLAEQTSLDRLGDGDRIPHRDSPGGLPGGRGREQRARLDDETARERRLGLSLELRRRGST